MPHPQSDAIIAKTLNLSRYARRLVESAADLKDGLAAKLDIPWTAEEMLAALTAAPIPDENVLKKNLRQLRSRVMLRLIARDLGELASLREVMGTASLLAETTLCFALAQLNVKLRAQYGAPIGEDSGGVQDLIVVAMGKLGGFELNVSSDIDLIFAYPEEGQTSGPRVVSNHEYFSLLGKKLIQALNDNTEDGFVFRVDMRLRPYGDSGPLVAGFAMLEEYYLTQGREWERYAWIKGRPLVGAGQEELTALLRPFVFRKYLDFGAFASMRDLHGQVRREVARRDMSDNIKLGPGGIREIEFITQVFQLIRGGKDVELQTRSTLTALDLLEQRQLLPEQAVRELRDAYYFLRNLEHRLQYLDDAQTQTLPANDADRRLIADAMGYAAYDDFLAVLNGHRDKVTHHFEQVFATPQNTPGSHPLAMLWQGAPIDSEAIDLLGELGFHRPQPAWERLKQIKQGGRYNQLPESSRARFDALLPPLIQAACAFPNPDDTLERILKLLEAISRRAAYLALMLEYPQTLNQVARLASASPWVSDYLTLHPILLDELLDTRALLAALDWKKLSIELKTQLDAAAGDTERQMDILRHFKQTQVFRLVAQDLEGALPLETLSDHLSDLADLILSEIIRLAWEGLRTKHREIPRFAIIGYGKLGGKELGYASDLDIIYLYDDDADSAPEIYARLGQRINTWLTSYTSAGTLYDTDLRLRPNGNSGLLVSSVEAFEEYQKKEAWVWEHQALTRARLCAGDAEIGKQFERIRCEVLRQARDTTVLKQEVLAMRQKMHDAHTNTSGRFDLKNDSGGIIDVEFIVQYLVLTHSAAHPELTRNSGNLALLEAAAQAGLIPVEMAEESRAAYREFRKLQHRARLQAAPEARVDGKIAEPQATAVRRLWGRVFGAGAPS